MTPHTHAWLVLTLTPGLGPTLIGRIVEYAGGAVKALELSAAQLGQVQGISDRLASSLRRSIDEVIAGEVFRRELDLVDRYDTQLLALDDPDYLALLKAIPAAPPLLWVMGKLDRRDNLSLAVVGSRRCSHYGREQADLISNALACSGVTVVSGGAYGIDIAAHRGALRAAKAGMGRTIAVLGSGLAKPYPQDHKSVFEEIVEGGGERGALISEFPMGMEPRPENFLRRNRVVSGMCVGTLVVEAGRRSGALSTARRCVDEQGRELMALPGRVDSAQSEGCHQIIKEGWGRLVTGVSDILDVIGEQAPLLDAASEIRTQSLGAQAGEKHDALPGVPGPGGASILAVLDTPRSLDEVVSWTGLPAAQVQGELTLLEIRGAVARQGGLFVRRRG